MKLFKETRDKAKALGIEVEDISAKLESVELVLNGTVTSRHIRGADALTVVDADSTATACGPYVSMDMISFYTVCINPSFVKGMSEFLEGKVSLVCRKIILIHGQGLGFCYLEDKRFK